jgi:ligand-binding sensor domain-containing protein
MLGRFILRQSTLFFLFVPVLAVTVYAQGNLNFTSLTVKDGLSSNTVNSIHRDRYGLIWFGTADGLNKFDGTNFTIYRHDVSNNRSISGNEIITLYEDRSGRLWTAATGGGLTYYDRQLNSFVHYRGNGSLKNIGTMTVKAICQDSKGNLWVATYEGLIKIDLETNKITTLYLNPNHLLTDQVILCLFRDSHNRMWVGTTRGLYLYNSANSSFKHFDHQESDPASLSSGIIKQICEDVQGNIWLATFNGLNLLLPQENSFRIFKHSENLPESLSNNRVYAVTPYDKDHLWIGTEDGLNILDTKTLKFTALKPNPRNLFSLTNRSVRCIMIDKGGTSWLGTFQGGVNKYDSNLALFNLVKSNSFDKQGLLAPIVTSFAEYNKDRIFIGTDGGGVHLFDKGTGLFSHINLKISGRPSNNLSVLALEMDKTQKLWIGTYQNGLFRLDPENGTYTHFVAGNRPDEINQNDIFCIKEDSKGQIWIGTNGKGVNVYDPITHIFHKFTRYPITPDDIFLPLNDFMRSITEDATGDIWLGSAGNGLAVYHPRIRTFSVYNRENSGLADDGISTVFHDSHHTTWVGTNGGGICRYDNETHRFKTYSEKDGLANGFVYKILEDDKGILWLSTDNGISSFDPLNHQFKNFSNYNGLQDGPFHPICSVN